MEIIDKFLLERLSAKAKASPRLRMNYDLHNSKEDGSQRMFNTIESWSVMSIHQH